MGDERMAETGAVGEGGWGICCKHIDHFEEEGNTSLENGEDEEVGSGGNVKCNST